MHDPLWNEIAAFLCRHAVIPRGHQLGPGTRLLQDLRLSGTEARELLERFFAFFRIRGDASRPACVLLASRRRWPWARRRGTPGTDISASMLLQAAREGRWPDAARQENRPNRDAGSP